DVGRQVELHDHVQDGELTPVLLGELGGRLEGDGRLGREIVGDEDAAEEACWHRCSFPRRSDPSRSKCPATRRERGVPGWNSRRWESPAGHIPAAGGRARLAGWGERG